MKSINDFSKGKKMHWVIENLRECDAEELERVKAKVVRCASILRLAVPSPEGETFFPL